MLRDTQSFTLRNEQSQTRRDFMKTAVTAAAAGTLSSGMNVHAAEKRHKVALVGTGARGIGMWGKPVADDYSDVVEFAALCDLNTSRAEWAKGVMGVDCPVYAHTDFDAMLDDTKPGRVVIATRDYAHEPYIVRAMEKGYDVISEKPLATDEGQIQRIIDAEKSTGQRLVITLNLRFSPFAVAIKEIVDSGEIGKVRSLDLTYFVGTPHGSSYYHRWHAYKKFNGSMFVTKSCHHFDLINWWLGAEPNTVNAYADLNMFGANGPFRSEKCRGCPHKNDCEWYFDITENDRLMRMYVDHEHVDGYHRDGCVYRSNIDVWDTMSAQVKYNDDTLVTYTLNLFLPYEGFRVGINGEKGRLDARIYMRQPWEVEQVADFRITGIDGATRAYPFEPTAGGHWGADTNLKDMLFRGPVPDTLGQTAESREGALAALIGVAARRSAEWGRPVTIDELVNF